jgi:hypothetical protein
METPTAGGRPGDTPGVAPRRPRFIDDDECVRAFVELLDESLRSAPDPGDGGAGADASDD